MRVVGDGVNSWFWTDGWFEGEAFCDRYMRLFDLVENKDVAVANMTTLD